MIDHPQAYYRLVKPFPPEKEEFGEDWVGELFYLIEIKGDEIELLQGDDSWQISLTAFEECFKYAPEGIAERQERIGELMGGILTAGVHSDNLIDSARTTNILTDQNTPEKKEDSNSRQPVSAGHNLRLNGSEIADTVRQNVKRVKAQAAKVKIAVSRHQSELTTYVAEQRAIMERKASVLVKQIRCAEEAIYIINSYLGTDEEIIRLQKGKPADADVKISIRQQILYMDEECALDENLAERGGIDFEKIDEFDKWITKPKNLQQVIPEEKAIVALKPRRKDKWYSDNPFVNADLNRQNKCLYILIRNGENVWRVYSTLWLEDVLLPRKDEFDDYFANTTTRYHHDKNARLRPGSAKFIEAMEQASAHRRRFSTVLLIIQGLLDRTKIFRPMPSTDVVNICDLASAQKWITLIYDAENLLDGDRPRFNEWLEQINERMDVGCRIIGYFDSIGHRRFPATAYVPKSEQLHVLEKAIDKGKFAFYYKRDGETVYEGWGDWDGHEAKNRARFTVYRNDKTVINFDAAEIDDMEHYIHSRLDRHEYLSMIPLLRLTIAMKQRERREESPFRKLLIGEMSKHNGVTVAAAAEIVDELISWWKFRCRTHRALTSDDAKALRMIVPEHRRRMALSEAKDQADSVNAVITKRLATDNTLAIFQKKKQEYVAYRFHNDDNIFVQEEVWKWHACTSQLQQLSCKPWKTVDKRHESWELLLYDSRWKEWEIGARVNDYLTDDEREAAVEYGLDCLKKARQGLRKSETWRNKNLPNVVRNFLEVWHYRDGKRWLVPLVVTGSDEGIHLYFAFAHCLIPKFLLTSEIEDPDMGMVTILWDKKRKGDIEFSMSDHEQICATTTSPPWAPDYEYHYGNPQKILREFPKNIQIMRTEEEKVYALKEQARDIEGPLENFASKLQSQLKAEWFEEQRKKFLDEYEDEDGTFWEEYKVDLDVPYGKLYPSWFVSAACVVVEEGIDIEGWTIGKVVKEAEKRGFNWGARVSRQQRSKRRRRDVGSELSHFDELKDIIIKLTDEPEERDDER